MVTINQVKKGLGDYLEHEIMPKLPPQRQFLLGVAYGVSGGKMDAIIDTLTKHPVVSALGLITDNGLLDIDALHNAAAQQMQKQGRVSMSVPLIGELAFSESDIEALYNDILRA